MPDISNNNNSTNSLLSMTFFLTVKGGNVEDLFLQLFLPPNDDFAEVEKGRK